MSETERLDLDRIEARIQGACIIDDEGWQMLLCLAQDDAPALVAELRAERARVRELEEIAQGVAGRHEVDLRRLVVLGIENTQLEARVRELEGENDSMGVLCGLQSGHIAKLERLLRRVLAGQAIDGYALSHQLIDEITEAL